LDCFARCTSLKGSGKTGNKESREKKKGGEHSGKGKRLRVQKSSISGDDPKKQQYRRKR